MNPSEYTLFVKNQPIISTHEDSQGEKRDKAFLDRIVKSMPPQYPLGQHHDMRQDTIGYLENFRVVEIANEPGEWQIIADVHVKGDADVVRAVGGFSYSCLERYKDNAGTPEGCIYLPYPSYNDERLIAFILDNESGISVGKWYKKSADPQMIALIGTFLVFVLNPAWRRVYDDHVHPFLVSAIKKCKKLVKDGYVCDYAQSIKVKNNRTVNVYFVADRQNNLSSLDPALVKSGLEKVTELLENDRDVVRKGASLVKLYYDSNKQQYVIFYVQFEDGTFMNYG